MPLTPQQQSVLNWAEVVAALVSLGITTSAQVGAVVKMLTASSAKTDIDYAPEDATLSAETHGILAAIIAKAKT